MERCICGDTDLTGGWDSEAHKRHMAVVSATGYRFEDVRVPKFRDPKAEKLRLYAQRGPFVGQVIRNGPYTHRVLEIIFRPDWTVWVRTRNSVGWYVTEPTNWQHWRTR